MAKKKKTRAKSVSVLVPCPECKKLFHSRGLNKHIALTHKVVKILVKTPVKDLVKPVKDLVNPPVKALVKDLVNPKQLDLTEEIKKIECDCSKYELINHPYLKYWNARLGIHIHTMVCSNCGCFEKISEAEFHRRLR